MPVSPRENSVSRATPRLHKTREWILEYVSEHGLLAGDKLPSDRQLSQMLGQSRETVAKAMTQLADEGLLTCEPRSGTYVKEPAVLRPAPRAKTVALFLPCVWEDRSGGLASSEDGASAADPHGSLNLPAILAGGVFSALSSMRYRHVIYSYNPKGEGELPVINEMVAHGLDGIIAWAGSLPCAVERWKEIAVSGLPTVFIDWRLPQVEADSVVSDNFGGAKEATRYLTGRGHRRIAYFTQFVEVTSAQDREAGYKAALQESGIEHDPRIVCGPCLVDGGVVSFTPMLERCLMYPEPVTAIFGMNDDTTWWAVQAVGELGLVVGKDIEVVGFFDTPIPRGVPLSFGRVVQNKSRIGKAAARLLSERMEMQYSGKPRNVIVPTQFVPPDSGEGSWLNGSKVLSAAE